MKFSKYLMVAALAVAGSLAASSAASAGLTCRGMVWGYGLNMSKTVSRIQARNAWRANAGPSWSNTSLAKNKSKKCRKEARGGGQKWHCVFKARPCRNLGLRQ